MTIKKILLAFSLMLGLTSSAIASQGTGCMPTTGTVSGLTFSQDVNAANAAFISSNSGASAPATDCSGVPIKGQLWLNTTVSRHLLEMYDGSSWNVIGTLDSTNHLWISSFVGYGSISSSTTTDLGIVAEPSIKITGSTTINSFGYTASYGTIKIVQFMSSLTLTYNSTSLILPTSSNIVTQANDSALLIYNGSGNWTVISYNRADGTPLGVSSTYANLLLNTLGTTRGSILEYGASGWTPINPSTTAGQVLTSNGSGSDPSYQNPSSGVSIRQTVLSGPNTTGVPSILPSTSVNLNLTTQNISTGVNAFIVTASNGFSVSGNVDVTGQATSNFTYTGLTASSTNYLGVVVSGGALTTVFTVQPPVYQYGGSIAVTNNVYTFDIAQMKMFVGNGTTVSQTNTVFIGEAVTNGSAVTSTIAYQYNGYYDSGLITPLPGPTTFYSKNSNLGVLPKIRIVEVTCLTTEGNYSVGDTFTPGTQHAGLTSTDSLTVTATKNTIGYQNYGLSAMIKNSSGIIILTGANWAVRITASRGW